MTLNFCVPHSTWEICSLSSASISAWSVIGVFVGILSILLMIFFAVFPDKRKMFFRYITKYPRMAIQWMKRKDIEIARLRAENDELKLQIIKLSAKNPEAKNIKTAEDYVWRAIVDIKSILHTKFIMEVERNIDTLKYSRSTDAIMAITFMNECIDYVKQHEKSHKDIIKRYANKECLDTEIINSFDNLEAGLRQIYDENYVRL